MEQKSLLARVLSLLIPGYAKRQMIREVTRLAIERSRAEGKESADRVETKAEQIPGWPPSRTVAPPIAAPQTPCNMRIVQTENLSPDPSSPVGRFGEDAYIEEWRDTLEQIWSGTTETVEFTYLDRKGDRTRRQVDVTELLRAPNGRLYLYGWCHLRREMRTFSEDGITTMIKVKSRRLDIYDWIDKVAGDTWLK